MIITRAYAKKLIRAGKATITTSLRPDDNGRVYIAVDRYDVSRVDHYLQD